MSVSLWLDHSGREVINKDIVIIGGGIAGMSAAYWLQKEDPTLDIALIEKNGLGSGATGRNAGFITCGSVEHFNRLVGTHGEKKSPSRFGSFLRIILNSLKKKSFKIVKKIYFLSTKEVFLWPQQITN